MKAYVIVGSAGCYSDRRDWVVSWAKTREAADEFVRRVKKETRDFYSKYVQAGTFPYHDEWLKYKETGLDKHCQAWGRDAPLYGVSEVDEIPFEVFE